MNFEPSLCSLWLKRTISNKNKFRSSKVAGPEPKSIKINTVYFTVSKSFTSAVVNGSHHNKVLCLTILSYINPLLPYFRVCAS